MIGPLEILILLVVLLIVFGGYKALPALGRSAGKGARVGGEKAKEIAGTVGEKASAVDPASIGKSAGKGIREARELREAITGTTESTPTQAPTGESSSVGERAGGESREGDPRRREEGT